MEIKWTKYMKVDPELRSLWLNIWPYPRHTRVASIVSRSLLGDGLVSQRSAGELLQLDDRRQNQTTVARTRPPLPEPDDRRQS